MIRKRVPYLDDAAIYRLVQRELLPHTQRFFPELRVDRRELKHRLDDSEVYVFAAALGSTALGFISLQEQANRSMFVDMLAVDRTCQGKGAGSRLMAKAEQTAVRKGCRSMHLWVNEDNAAAIAFYAKHRFYQSQYDARRHVILLEKRIGYPF